MRVLFFIEPRVDSGQPYLREWWLSPFTADMIATLRAAPSGDRYQFAIGINEALALKRGGLEGARTEVFAQRELFPAFVGDATDLAVSWYRGTYRRDHLEYYAQLVRSKFDGFDPEVVITFSPAPYLAHAFPAALVLHHEACLFNRAPFPHTWFFDPVGMYFGRPSFLDRFARQIDATPVGPEQAALLGAFREDCRSLLLATSPFRDIVARLRERFRKVVLLPLLGEHHWGFVGPSRMVARNEFQFLADVLERVPRDIAVVTTYPPDLVDPYGDDMLDYLRRRYPHFVYDDAFSEVYSPSQFLFPEVDALIGMQSSLCFQAMLFERPFVDLGGDLQSIADGVGADAVDDVLARGPRNRDGFLYWMLTRSAVLHEHLHDPEWFSGFLEHSRRAFLERGIDSGFYRPVDTDARIFQLLGATMDRRLPQPARFVSYRRQTAELQRLRATAEAWAAGSAIGHGGVEVLQDAIEQARRLAMSGRSREARAVLDDAAGRLRGVLSRVEALGRYLENDERAAAEASARGGRGPGA